MIKQCVNVAKALVFLLVPAAFPFYAAAQNAAYSQVSFANLSAFKDAPANWSIAGNVTADFEKPNALEKKAGQGILVNIPGKNKNEDIFTTMEHGDINLDVDFMMPKGSNSGIYLQGRYEIQLFDSWGKDVVNSTDLGAVYERWDDSKPEGEKGYQGIAPRINVSRAPGLWQNIKISFLAPKFDAVGKKIANAKIVKIELNGVVIIENAVLTGPTRGSAFPNEAPMGPLRLQGDHGAVAFRSIKYNTAVVADKFDMNKQRGFGDADKPSFVEVKDEPVILRSFVNFGDKTLSHVVNVGCLHHLNFSYDMENGAVFQAWRGGFVDATPMWWFRGDGTTKALGSVVLLNDAPPLATLSNATAAWPDTIADATAYRAKGYELDGQGYPTFKYIEGGLHIEDKLMPADDGKKLERQITVTGGETANLYYRVASAKSITALNNGVYSINNFEYYIQLPKDSKLNPVLRTTANGAELLLPVNDNGKGASLEYSMIW